MSTDRFEECLKQAITYRYHEKYGKIQIHFDLFRLITEHSAAVQFTLSDARGFITRYYGVAAYQAGQLQMNVKSI